MSSLNLPYRTGLPTLRTVCRTIIRVWTAFRPVVAPYLLPQDLADIDDLMACANKVVEIVSRVRGD